VTAVITILVPQPGRMQNVQICAPGAAATNDHEPITTADIALATRTEFLLSVIST
jgi:hypothetical protein